MVDEHRKNEDTALSEPKQPVVMVVPGLEALAGPLIAKLGPVAGREIYNAIREDEAVVIRIEESWMYEDDFYAILRLINLTAHGVYIEEISCPSEQVDASFSQSNGIFGHVMSYGSKDVVEWFPLSDFRPQSVNIFSEIGVRIALKISGVNFRKQSKNIFWQNINQVDFKISFSRLDKAKLLEKTVCVMLRRADLRDKRDL